MIRKFRTAAALLGANVFAIVVLCALIELGARFVVPFPHANVATYTSDRDTIYAHRPNSGGWEVSPVDEFPPV